MALVRRSRIFGLAVCALAAASAARAAAIQVSTAGSNAACYLSNCTPDTISYSAPSTSSTYFTFLYTAASGDEYQISGDSVATTDAWNANVTATYEGNTGNAAEASVTSDALVIDIVQNFYDSDGCPGPGCNWDGTYSNGFILTIGGPAADGSSAAGSLLWDGETLGLVGPVTVSSPLTSNIQLEGVDSANLTGLDGATLTGDLQYDFTFAAGSQAGAFETDALPTPEPSEVFPAAILLALASLWSLLRRKQVAVFVPVSRRRGAR